MDRSQRRAEAIPAERGRKLATAREAREARRRGQNLTEQENGGSLALTAKRRRAAGRRIASCLRKLNPKLAGLA